MNLKPPATFGWRRQWQPTPVCLPGKSHGRRSLVGCSPWGCEESDTTSLSLSLLTFIRWRRKWQPTPVFLPGESQGWGSLAGSIGLHRVKTQLKLLSGSSSSNLWYIYIMELYSTRKNNELLEVAYSLPTECQLFPLQCLAPCWEILSVKRKSSGILPDSLPK